MKNDLQNLNPDTSPQNFSNDRDDIEQHNAVEDYAAWLDQREREALADFHDGGQQELRRLEHE